jgi:hypothetical protein
MGQHVISWYLDQLVWALSDLLMRAMPRKASSRGTDSSPTSRDAGRRGDARMREIGHAAII